MRRIIYASTSRSSLSSTELDELAYQAQKNNLAQSLTGLLLYGDHSFFQVLEGPAAKVEEMKKRIWADPRHRGISQFQDKSIEIAAFPDWSMGCYRVDSSPSSTLWRIADFDSIQEHLPADVPPEILVFARSFFTSISPRNALLGQQ